MHPSRLLLLATAACSVAALTVPSVASADTAAGGSDRSFVTTRAEVARLIRQAGPGGLTA